MPQSVRQQAAMALAPKFGNKAGTEYLLELVENRDSLNSMRAMIEALVAMYQWPLWLPSTRSRISTLRGAGRDRLSPRRPPSTYRSPRRRRVRRVAEQVGGL